MEQISGFNSLPELLTVKELTRYLRISTPIANDLISSGKIKAFKISSRIVRIPKEEVIKYLNSIE